MEEENQTENPSQNIVNSPEPIVQTPEVPQALASSNSRKYLIWGGIIVLILLLLGTTGYFAYRSMQLKKQVVSTPPPTSTPTTTNETANWKTYTNMDIGYSFQYPSDWQLAGDSSNVTITKDNYSLRFLKPPHKLGAIPSSETVTTKNITINNKQYSETIVWKDQENNLVDFETMNLDKGLEIHFYYKDLVYNKTYATLFNQILSTFKFTE